HIVNLMTVELNKLKEKHGNAESAENIETENIDETLKDPEIVRSKGCGQNTKGTSRRCGGCGQVGHNIRSYQHIDVNTTMNEQSDSQRMEDTTANTTMNEQSDIMSSAEIMPSSSCMTVDLKPV
ncbi:hypothetical protein A2U01_0009416, partial [Trifolium medium]|nr:hypothetical protein [Trifolium medium]